MLKKNYRKLILVLFTIFFSSVFGAQGKKVSDTLRVGVAGSAPFFYTENGSKVPQGAAVDIWQEVANQKNWNYKYQNFTSVKDALQSMREGNLDILVGPITINSDRVQNFKFSQPFYQSSLAIVYKKGNFSLWNLVKLLFSYKLLIAIGIFLIILTFVGTMLWLAERKESPEQFPSEPAKGIGTGMWLAIVTMSTTGYGDKAPITLMGRIIAGTWMIVSIIFATSMVAGIASVLTFSNLQGKNITNIEQLNNKKVATISGSPSADYLKEYNVDVVYCADLKSAFKKLNDKSVEAIIYDRPQLLFYLNNHENEDLVMAKAEYYKQGYGFAFPKSSDLPYEVNRSLLELAENQEIEKIMQNYLGNNQH